jgi:hypothetical protein
VVRKDEGQDSGDKDGDSGAADDGGAMTLDRIFGERAAASERVWGLAVHKGGALHAGSTASAGGETLLRGQ